MISYLSSFLWRVEEQAVSTFEKNLQIQKTKLRKCIQPAIARNLPRHYTLKQIPKQELSEILNIKLRKTEPIKRQTDYGPRHPVLRQLLETIEKKNNDKRKKLIQT